MHTRGAAALLASFLAASSGWTTGVRRRRRRRADYRVYVVEYHDVGDDEGSVSDSVVPIGRFRQHLRYLKRHYRFSSLREAAARLRPPGDLSEDLVVVTFDDGYAGNFEWAWPVLRAESIPGTIFLTTGFLDGDGLWFDFARRALRSARRKASDLDPETRRLLAATFGGWPLGRNPEGEIQLLKYATSTRRSRLLAGLEAAGLPTAPAIRPLSWGQVRQMNEGGIDIGGHTVSHPILATLPRGLQQREIRESSTRITEETGTRPTSFAYPNGSAGDFNSDSLDILRSEGFDVACTSVRGSNRPGCDPLQLRRIGVGNEPSFVLAARLSGLFDHEIRHRLPW